MCTQPNMQPSFEDKNIMHVTLSYTLSTDLLPQEEEKGNRTADTDSENAH